ncbi:DNA methyltransferase [Gordonia zhaorongruii]|uniref:DNA methyltransferase n=1 Tax=Gordonia zhaorongruii TaxID=2597659 RepID=UPI001181687E|nr:DNA methyltransferase [Gordonia zhaorongruii]
MATDTAIVNVDEWIGEYYLTTDETKESFRAQVAALVKEWKNAPEGAVSPLSRFTAARQALVTSLSQYDAEGAAADADAESAAARRLVREALGYGEPVDFVWSRGDASWEAPVWSSAGGMLYLEADPVDTVEDLRSAGPWGEVRTDGKPVDAVLGSLIGELFLSDTPPAYITATAGRWFLLAERESWPLGRYLAVDLLLALERNDTRAGGEVQRVVAAASRESVEQRPDGTTWWTQVLQDSREHAVRVSGALREAIRESIEIIANDVLARRIAQGMSNDDIDGQVLAREALRYLYRVLFLLFAEASPELHILPVGATEYDDGYGLSRLRDHVLNPPATPAEENGTYLYASLALLFRKVDEGHHPADDPASAPGLEFNELSADLFSHNATRHIDEVGLSNRAMHGVLENLLMTREQSGRERGFISYATLGVTELGQVYEGLMSYSGFIADEDLWEVAKGGDASKGSWVVGRDDMLDFASNLVRRFNPRTGENDPVCHSRGAFVFRQSSRDRERSASFYTPQVISTFVVEQALAELDESGAISQAEDILDLTICEPAMGSGAFAVEAVRQLAELYLERRQRELGDEITPDERTAELQKVKAYLALHQVYGVDLNATAVELAEIALWLDTMTPGLKAPWFGLHLKRGNSLLGCRRATYSSAQVAKKEWLVAEPMDAPLTGLAESNDTDKADPLVFGRIHHFLLPAAGWGSASDAKELKPYAGDEQKALKEWRKKITLKPSKEQIKRLEALSRRVERLWQISLVKLQIAEDQVRRQIDVYGAEDRSPRNPVSRDRVEASLGDPNGALQRLRRAMDAWCAMWFWPLDGSDVPIAPELVRPPSIDDWIDGMEALLGRAYEDEQRRGTRRSGEGQIRFGGDMSWEQIENAEEFDRILSQPMTAGHLVHHHPWFAVCDHIAERQGFFHWELDFAPVFARGGFSLQVGNPPWVRPRTDEDALWGESDPWWILAHKPTQPQKSARRELTAERQGAVKTVVNGLQETVVTSKFLNDQAQYPLLAGQQPDLYRAFMQRSWRSAAADGIVTLIHPESHFTEKAAAPLRRSAYMRLRRHFQFVNELSLFDVHDLVRYGIHVYGSPNADPNFQNLTGLYQPKTASDSFSHDGQGSLPGFKDDNNNWDLRPHRDRILTVDRSTLELWASILEEPDVPWLDARMVYSVTREAEGVLRKLAAAPRVKELGLHYSRGWDETIDKKKGYFDTKWAVPESWDDVILQGPHFGVANPFAKQPNPTLKHNQDWTEIDLEAIDEDFIPATAYQPNREGTDYDADYSHYSDNSGIEYRANKFPRLVWRMMAATTGFRTLYPSLIPSGAAHVHGVQSAVLDNPYDQIATAGSFSSIILDFQIRSTGTSNIFGSSIDRLPNVSCGIIGNQIGTRYLALNCLHRDFVPLIMDSIPEGTSKVIPLRRAESRRHAQIEIDALVALGLGVTADELCMIYRTQFPVMRRYDMEDLFDANGRIVPKDVAKLEKKLKPGTELSEADRTWTHPQSGVEYVFEYPFRALDREVDMRAAYAKFQTALENGEL